MNEENPLLKTYKILRNIVIAIIAVIAMLIIIFIIGYFAFAKPINDEDEALGYGPMETVRIDPMTGEKIPKAEIDTYSNDDLYITKSNGDKVYFKEINEYRDSLCDIATNKIKDENINKVIQVCDILIVDDLGATYYIKENTLYINKKSMIGSTNLKKEINAMVKDIYREQNNLD